LIVQQDTCYHHNFNDYTKDRIVIVSEDTKSSILMRAAFKEVTTAAKLANVLQSYA
jgi:hypothetical protein